MLLKVLITQQWSSLEKRTVWLLHSKVNNFVDWPHCGADIHYRGYVEPRDGAVSVLSLRQEACGVFRKKGIHSFVPCCERKLSARDGNRQCRSFGNGKTSSSARNEANSLAKRFR
jgi:hypothetical protein